MNIINEYKRKQKIRNISIVMFSLSLAIIFSSLLNQTWVWMSIKSSIMESSWIQTNNEIKSDLFLEKVDNTSNNIFSLKNSKDLIWVKSISLWVAYNNENVDLDSKILKIEWWEIIDLLKNDWFNTLIINFKNPINIKKNEDILNLSFKKDNTQQENINLIWTNFLDKDNNNYNLSTSWISF